MSMLWQHSGPGTRHGIDVRRWAGGRYSTRGPSDRVHSSLMHQGMPVAHRAGLERAIERFLFSCASLSVLVTMGSWLYSPLRRSSFFVRSRRSTSCLGPPGPPLFFNWVSRPQAEFLRNGRGRYHCAARAVAAAERSSGLDSRGFGLPASRANRRPCDEYRGRSDLHNVRTRCATSCPRGLP